MNQVCTGEGKSLIIVAFACIKALSGLNVDVVTSSSVLAERDAREHADLYDKFCVRAGHNNSDAVADRQAAYSDCHVVYGDVASFQRDLLRDGFYGEDCGIGARAVGCVVVDEVDSMLLDKGHNVLYLSHTVAGLDVLELIFVLIWNLVHAKDASEETLE